MTDALTHLDQHDQFLRLSAVGENIDALLWFSDAGAAQIVRYADRAIAAAAQLSDDVGDIVIRDMTALKREIAEIAATSTQLGALVVGAVEMARGFRDQRDAALHELAARPTAASLYDDLVARIAEMNGCSLADAQRLAYILVSSDEDVMQNDVVVGLDRLQQFRDSVMGATDELNTRVLP